MKRIAFFLTFLLISLLTVQLSQCEVVDKVVVVVNTEIITQSEIDSALAPMYEQYKALYYGDELVKRLEEARRKVIDKLIEDKLILSEAKKQNIEVTDKEVEVKLEEVRGRFPSRTEFDKALAEQGMNVRDLRERYKEQIMIRKVIDQKVGARIRITPVEMSNYYTTHINEFVQPEMIKLRNILIRPKQDLSVEKASALVRDIHKRVAEGGDFAALAKEYSEGPNAQEGGLMDYVKKGDLLPEIEAVVFKMKEGEISDVIQTCIGYHIFKVEKREERRTKTLSEVKNEVENAVYWEKVKNKVKDWVEGLKKSAYIAFK